MNSRSVTLALRRNRPSLLTVFASCYAAWQQRQDLARLEDHLLEDIGYSRAEVHKETNKPFWDAPHSWKK
jgi:uncharacterized protein YjiS (DUF1127 family)